MDSKSQERLQSILSKHVTEITEQDADVLRARRSYLTTEDCEKFKEFLDAKPGKKPNPEKTLDNEKKSNKSKSTKPSVEPETPDADQDDPEKDDTEEKVDPETTQPEQQEDPQVAKVDPHTHQYPKNSNTCMLCGEERFVEQNATGQVENKPKVMIERNPYEDDGSSDPDSQ